MKSLKLLALIVCASAFVVGCSSSKCCAPKAESACGMQCCADGKTTCATCPKCSAKK